MPKLVATEGKICRQPSAKFGGRRTISELCLCFQGTNRLPLSLQREQQEADPMQKAAIAIGVIAILGVPALTTAAPIDRTTIVAQEGKAAPPHHRKRIVRRTPYNTNAPSHSSEHGDVGDRGGGTGGGTSGGTSGSAAGGGAGGGGAGGAGGGGGGGRGSGGGGGGNR